MVPCQRTRKLKATLTNANRTFPNMTSSTEDERLIPTIKRALTLHCGIILLCKTNMAARFPASASMQRMANNPQQASMFQRSQFQQSPYGMAVSFWFIDCLNSLLGHLKLCQLNTHEGYFLS